MDTNLADKICIVTGATNGIGRETALALAKMSATVVVVGRNVEKCAETVEAIKLESGNPNVEWIAADLSRMSGVQEVADEFKARHRQLHILVNNAGGVFANRRVTADGYEMTFALNHLNYFLLTDLLMDTLKGSAPSRVVNVSSDAHYRGHLNFDDLMAEQRYNGFGVYSSSKLANVMFTYALARRLEGTGVTANVLHPGFVASGFGRNNGGLMGALMPLVQLFAISSEQGAATSIYLASSPEVEGVSGKYFAKQKAKKSSDESYDADAQERLWNTSEGLVAQALSVTTEHSKHV